MTAVPTPTSAPTPSSAPAPTDAAGPLRLLSVLTSGLPQELGTAQEPTSYTVPVVFSRQVTHDERAHIEDPATARLLVERTRVDPALALVVEDRRLLVEHISLHDLENGLAAALGEMLSSLGAELDAARALRAAQAGVRQVREQERADEVARAAARIRFEPAGDHVADDAPSTC